MLQKKFYLPIGMLILVICTAGLLSLRSDVPTEPIKVYKAVEPVETPAKATTAEVKETSTTDTAASGHKHADSTWHSQPHSEETAQEKFDREMLEKMAAANKRLEAANKRLEAANKRLEAAKQRDATLRAELEALKAKDAERTKHLSRLTERRDEFLSKFSDLLEMTPEKFLASSETEQEETLLLCVEYDLFVEEIQGIIKSIPQWVIDELDERRPGEIDEFLNLPSLTELYGRL